MIGTLVWITVYFLKIRFLITIGIKCESGKRLTSGWTRVIQITGSHRRGEKKTKRNRKV